MRTRRPKPPPVTYLIDTNEQLPYVFDGEQVEHVPLFPWSSELARMASVPGDPNVRDGDYTARGIENYVRIERKEMADYVRCVGTDRDRFQAELERMAAYPFAFLLLEFSIEKLALGCYESRVKPKSAVGSALAWEQDLGIRVVWAGDRLHAQTWALRTLERMHRKRWLEEAGLWRRRERSAGGLVPYAT